MYHFDYRPLATGRGGVPGGQRELAERADQQGVRARGRHEGGATIGEWNVDKDGVDVTLRRRQLMVDLQLKCTGSARTAAGDYSFDLDVPTFAKLTDPDRSAPAYLCLLVVPKALQAWLHSVPPNPPLRSKH